MNRNYHILLAALLICCGCSDLRLARSESKLVMEGWIEDGRFPVVLLSTSVPVSTEPQDMESLQDHIVRWGKVTVSDGEREVVLTGGPDDRFIPPYMFSRIYSM